MKDDTREELERIEKELLSVAPTEDTVVIHMPLEEVSLPEEEVPEEVSEDASLEEILEDGLVKDILSQPSFEDGEQVRDAQEPEIFRNFSNGYGRDLQQTQSGEPEETTSREDKINIGLMIAASALCLGIIGVMIYWSVRFLG